MANSPVNPRIDWYRSPIDRDLLARLNQRSDLLGAAQTLGHLAIIGLTGAAAFYAWSIGSVILLIPALFLHGGVYHFLLNGFHELCHSSVFRTKWLNTFFLYLVSFISGHNPILFWASHQEHHKFTLHPPDDLEVTLPVKLTLAGFLRSGIVNFDGIYHHFRGQIRLALGIIDGEWANYLFPADKPEARRRLFAWTRFSLLGHLAIVVASIASGYWIFILLITLAPFYGGLVQHLCNNTQHSGLADDVTDYRLCTRTITLNPLLQFLYWHMNFHIEHHMYAAVPCYNLPKLHAAIRHDLPPTPNGLVETWKLIGAIMKRQAQDPSYVHVPQLPRI
jgi:fatty acid desaturase